MFCELAKCRNIILRPRIVIGLSRDVKPSRPKWPQGQNFGLGLSNFMQYVFCEKGIRIVQWGLGRAPEAGEFLRIFVL